MSLKKPLSLYQLKISKLILIDSIKGFYIKADKCCSDGEQVLYHEWGK